MRLLVIFEEVPETPKYAILDEPNSDHVRILRASHNRYINGEDWPEAEELSSLFYTEDGRFEGAPIQLTDMSGNTPLEGPFDLVIHTGFIL